MRRIPLIITAAASMGLLAADASAQTGVSLGNSGAIGANGPSALRSGVVRQSPVGAQRFNATARFGHTFHGGGFGHGFPHRGFGVRDGFFPGHGFGTRVRIGIGDANDDFRLRADLGGGAASLLHHDLIRHKGNLVRFRHGFPIVVLGTPHFGSHHLGGLRYPYGHREPYYWSSPIEYRTDYQDPRLSPEYRPRNTQGQGSGEEPRELTALERARLALAFEDLGEATASYREHLDAEPGDGIAMRELALALLEDERVPEGVALLRHAYEVDPSLARDPIDARALGPEAKDRLSGLVRRVAIYANQGESSSGWLAITVLIQAQGRDRVARMNLERAMRAGLDRALARPIGLALGYPEPELRERLSRP